LSETAVVQSYAFEQLAPANPAPVGDLARAVAQARAEAASIREQARDEGYAEGHAAGRQQGLVEVSTAARALGEALAGVHAMREELVEALERDAVELGLALAEKVLRGALQAKPELVVEAVKGALRRIGDRRGIVVLVNPSDLETVRSFLGGERGDGVIVEPCEVQGDARVAPGGAIARTTEGEVDASMQTQLERAREVMLAELGSEPRA
jgi:flagellar assembly protein FliH